MAQAALGEAVHLPQLARLHRPGHSGAPSDDSVVFVRGRISTVRYRRADLVADAADPEHARRHRLLPGRVRRLDVVRSPGLRPPSLEAAPPHGVRRGGCVLRARDLGRSAAQKPPGRFHRRRKSVRRGMRAARDRGDDLALQLRQTHGADWAWTGRGDTPSDEQLTAGAILVVPTTPLVTDARERDSHSRDNRPARPGACDLRTKSERPAESRSTWQEWLRATTPISRPCRSSAR